MLIPRKYEQDMGNCVSAGKVLVIYGPRQVGKTTLVKSFTESTSGRRFSTTGEDAKTRDVLMSMSQDMLRRNYGDLDLLFIGEAQAIPEIGKSLKLLVDTLPDLKVIATGSSSFELAGQIGEPLVGRRRVLTLYPLSFDEICDQYGFAEANASLDSMLVYGMYPEVFLAETNAGKARLLKELAESYLYKDIVAFESLRNAAKIRQLMTLLAFQVGKEVSLTELGCNLSLARQTVERYLDLLEKCFVIYRVGGFSRNLRNEVTKSNRWYFYDNGVMNAVSSQFNELQMRGDAGALWENWIMAERLKHLTYSGRFPTRYFWRTYAQAEINSIEDENGKLNAWEFKFGTKKPKPPASWRTAYPDADWGVINKDNFDTFIR